MATWKDGRHDIVTVRGLQAGGKERGQRKDAEFTGEAVSWTYSSVGAEIFAVVDELLLVFSTPLRLP